jgi:hypothetical protein
VNAQDYHRQLVAQIDSISAIVSSEISFREIDENECYIKAILIFATGHELRPVEYVVIQNDQVQRSKYHFQLLSIDNKPPGAVGQRTPSQGDFHISVPSAHRSRSNPSVTRNVPGGCGGGIVSPDRIARLAPNAAF